MILQSSLITSSHDVLQFDREKSVALCVGIDEQFHPNYAAKSLRNTVARDAQAMGEAFTTYLELNFDEVKVRKSSAQPGDCTKKGMGTLFVESAKKVQEGGIFIFYFAGHGILIGNRCVLAPADFAGKEDLNSGISGKDLVEWLHEADCKANHVLIILDCCYAGNLGTILTSPDNMLKIKPGLYVMCGCAAREKCTSVDALGHSIFTYFFLHYLERHQCIGQFAIKQAMEDIAELCLSFSSLLVHHDEEQLQPGKMNPTLDKLDVHAYDVNRPIDQPDSCRFELVIQLFERGRPKPLPMPHPEVESWLKSSMIQEALSTLYAKDTFSEKLQDGIFSAMLYSAASIQYVHNKTHLEERNLFLMTVISILGAIGYVYPEVNASIIHLIIGLEHYQAAIVGKIKMNSLNELHSKMIEVAIKADDNTTTPGPIVAAENCDDEVDCFIFQPNKFNKVAISIRCNRLQPDYFIIIGNVGISQQIVVLGALKLDLKLNCSHYLYMHMQNVFVAND